MARQAKDTVTVKVNEIEYEVTPSLDFDIETLNAKEVTYLLTLGMKQRIGSAVRASFTAIGPEIEQTKKAMADLKAIGADDSLIQKFVAGKPFEYPNEITLKHDDIFPKSLTAVESEPEPEVKPTKKGKK